jgi:uncharacterized membrane protein (DUF4010 family)
MSVADTFEVLGIALALGLLVGMQRERVEAPLAGLRTFALITILGAICGLMAIETGAWIIAAGLIGVSAAMVMGSMTAIRKSESHAGITTEIAILVMFMVGAYLSFGPRAAAVSVAGATAVLLHAKGFLHGMVKRLGDADVRAIMQFVLVALVILPVLPNEPYGPFDVLNPRQIWLIVVLVTGISLGSYLALKFLGDRAGTVVSGLLGGMVSSTATTVSFARRASNAASQVAAATLVIMLASAVVKVRVLVEVAIVAPGQFWNMAPPILVMLGATALLSVWVWWSHRNIETELPEQNNPAELKGALIFASLYAVVLLAVAAAQHWFGDRGIYVVSAISGLTDMDAITLSTSRMAQAGTLDADVAWRAIIIGSIANMIFKACVIGLLGGRVLLTRIAVLFGIAIAVGVALLLLWPAT